MTQVKQEIVHPSQLPALRSPREVAEEIVHPSQLPALRSPREVAEDIALWAIWNGYSAPEEGILSGGGLPALVIQRAGQSFLVNVEEY